MPPKKGKGGKGPGSPPTSPNVGPKKAAAPKEEKQPAAEEKKPADAKENGQQAQQAQQAAKEKKEGEQPRKEGGERRRPAVGALAPPPNAWEKPPGEHPLQTPWTIFLHKRQTQKAQVARSEGMSSYKAYESSLDNLGTFTTVEGFWRYFSYLKAPDQLPRDYDIFFMRHALVPAWETFPNGGSWYVKVRRGNGVINRLWQELAVATIAEMFAEPELVGIAVSIRTRDDVLQIWIRDDSLEVRTRVGERLKTLLSLHESTLVDYKLFRDAIKDGYSFKNAQQFYFAQMQMQPQQQQPQQQQSEQGQAKEAAAEGAAATPAAPAAPATASA